MIDQLLRQPMFRKVWRLVKEEATFPYITVAVSRIVMDQLR
jgi:hypothetical protein